MKTHRGLFCLAFVLPLGWSAPASGDGGTLRAWQRQDGCDVAVFTDPTPVVTGLVDVSVLVLDPSTGEPIEGADVTVELTLRSRPARILRRAATSEAATNKLLRAALFELGQPGRYLGLVTVAGSKGRAAVEFQLDVGPSRMSSAGVWPWVLWPVPVIAVYGIHRRLVHSAERSRSRARCPRTGDPSVKVPASAGLDDARL